MSVPKPTLGALVSLLLGAACNWVPMSEQYRPFALWITLTCAAFFSIAFLFSHYVSLNELRHGEKGTNIMTLIIIFLVGGFIAIAIWHVIPKANALAKTVSEGDKSGAMASGKNSIAVGENSGSVISVKNSNSGGVNIGQVVGNVIVNNNPANRIDFPDLLNQPPEKKKTDSQEPDLTRIFSLLREPGATFSMGQPKSDQYMEFNLGKLGQKGTNLIQEINISGSGFGFKGTAYGRPVDSGFEKGMVVGVSATFSFSEGQGGVQLDPPNGAIILFILKNGSKWEIHSQPADINITLIDTTVDSLKIKIEVSYTNIPIMERRSSLPTTIGNMIFAKHTLTKEDMEQILKQGPPKMPETNQNNEP